MANMRDSGIHVHEKIKNFLFFPIMVLITGLFFAGCASINILSDSTITKYKLRTNIEGLKNFQYYISRDIVLTSIDVSSSIDISRGQGKSSTTVQRDYIEFLSSTPGIALEVKEDNEGIMIGVAFESDNDNLLWFKRFREWGDEYPYFFLLSTDWVDNEYIEIEYAGASYRIPVGEEASGIVSKMKRIVTPKKATVGTDFEIPVLLYEENAKVKEKESRRTVGGRRLK